MCTIVPQVQNIPAGTIGTMEWDGAPDSYYYLLSYNFATGAVIDRSVSMTGTESYIPSYAGD